MKVELLYATGYPICLRGRDALKAAALNADPDLDWRELDIVEALDNAVELGVLKPPALASDGELVFSALPTPAALVAALRQRLNAGV